VGPAAQRRRKDLGAFYTGEVAVDFLVRWGLARVTGTVMDPACGDGRFLRAAARHGAVRLVGCDVDASALRATAQGLSGVTPAVELLQDDFFAIPPDAAHRADLIDGNPPFIRYQKFPEQSRRRALESALRLGVRLTRLTSTWAPFLLHAAQFLRPGGAMAVVVPAEIAQTNYGVPTLQALCRRFATVRLLAFARNFFPEAQTETYLLLADGYGAQPTASVQLFPMSGVEDLAAWESGGSGAVAGTRVELSSASRFSFAKAFLTPDEIDTWHRVAALDEIRQLTDLGVIANGYVSGANDFFHCCYADAVRLGLPVAWLLPTAKNANSLRGLEFTAQDVRELEDQAHPHHLISPPADDLFNLRRSELHKLVADGEALGIHTRFKCRTRTPWWRVPGIHVPDVFLPYMIGRAPTSSVNLARATYSNTLHGLRLHEGYDPRGVALGLHSTLSLLSMELEGRSYGGGVLKLEPSEVNRVQLVLPRTRRLPFKRIDALLRHGRYSAAVAAVDEVILRGNLGLDDGTIARLRSARARLVDRRCSRGRGKGN